MLGDFRNNILDRSIKDEEKPTTFSQTFQSQAHGPSPGFRNLFKVFKKDGSPYGNREPSILCHQALARYHLLFTPATSSHESTMFKFNFHHLSKRPKRDSLRNIHSFPLGSTILPLSQEGPKDQLSNNIHYSVQESNTIRCRIQFKCLF